jgi:hypothetical protein
MISKVIIEHDGKFVTDLATVQDTGKVSLGKVLHALGIPNDRWRGTLLQITVSEIVPEDQE